MPKPDPAEQFVADAVEASPSMTTRVKTAAMDPATWILAGAASLITGSLTFFLGHKFGDKVFGGTKPASSILED